MSKTITVEDLDLEHVDLSLEKDDSGNTLLVVHGGVVPLDSSGDQIPDYYPAPYHGEIDLDNVPTDVLDALNVIKNHVINQVKDREGI